MTELMLGLVLGMLVSAAATLLFLLTLDASRQTVGSLTLNQTMRQLNALIVAELRRAAQRDPGRPSLLLREAGRCILYTLDGDERYYGFSLHDKQLIMKVSGGPGERCSGTDWQPLTEARQIQVEALRFDMIGSRCLRLTDEGPHSSEIGAADALRQPCETDAGEETARPGERRVALRQVGIALEASLTGAPETRLRLRETVQVRNPQWVTP